jgi:hypothetical protein
MNHKIVLPFILIALVTLACGITIDLETDVKTGPTQVEPINVPFLDPRTDTADVTVSFGAGTLNINADGKDALIAGNATFNVDDFLPEVSIDGNEVRIEQGSLDLGGVPAFPDDLINDWVLSIGDAPLELEINAGAYKGHYELGGLSIRRLEINDGAAEAQVSFLQPNQVEMSLFKYSTGASSIKLSELANANMSQFIFRSGAGSYTLDFSGELSRDMQVTIESGVSSITIIIPADTSAVLTTNGLLSVNASGSWEQNESTYTLSAGGPTITIEVDMGAGNLILETR